MGEMNVALYNEEIARGIVKSGDFRDREGCRVGTVENCRKLYHPLLDNLKIFSEKPSGALLEDIKDSAYELKSCLYCFREELVMFTNYMNFCLDNVRQCAGDGAFKSLTKRIEALPRV